MAKETVDVMVSGGKATAAPPLGPALGPKGVNIGQVVAEINKKTADYAGMQVPVTVTIDSDTKSFEISIGTPPATALVKQEAGIKKGSANAKADIVANISIDQVKKIANMKADALLGKSKKQQVKEIAGTCQSVGVSIEGMKAHDFIVAINEGTYDDQLKD